MQSLLLTVLGGIALLAADCGGGAKAPPVASLGTTPSVSSTDGSPSSVPPGGFLAGASMSTEVGTGTAGVKYAACMRSHGAPSYSDPNAQGVITITISAALNPSSPLFQKALAHCQKLIPAGKAPSPARQQRLKQGALAFSACMRSHGVPKYPDPKFGAGGTISQTFSRSDGDPSSLTFRAAQKACQKNRANSG